MLSLSSLGHIVFAISCPQGLWTTLHTDRQRHTIKHPSNDGRIKTDYPCDPLILVFVSFHHYLSIYFYLCKKKFFAKKSECHFKF